MARRYFVTILALCLAIAIAPGLAIAGAAAGGVYTLNQERMYARSDFGQRVQRQIVARQTKIKAENKKLEAELKAEELDLTRERPTLKPTAFRKLADAFDTKVQKIRKDQAIKARDLNTWAEAQKKRFFNLAFPILLTLAGEVGAEVVLAERTTIISSRNIDLTDRAIARINAKIGDGSKLATSPLPDVKPSRKATPSSRKVTPPTP